MLCPRCQQGDIAIAEVKKTGKTIYICEECEATWFSKEDIGVSPFEDFGTYMEKLGLSPVWGELEIRK
jgi:protein-arginine kinase activator protein McsA